MSAFGMYDNSFMYHDYTIEGRCWQFPIGPVDPWDEAIADDRVMFPPVHVHFSRYGRDCDGGHGDDGIIRPTKDDNFIADDVRHYTEESREALIGTLDVDKFWQRQVMFAISFSDRAGTLTLRCDDSDEYDRSAEYSAPTDEGYHATELRLCIDDCEPPRNSHYDQYAEMAGY